MKRLMESLEAWAAAQDSLTEELRAEPPAVVECARVKPRRNGKPRGPVVAPASDPEEEVA